MATGIKADGVITIGTSVDTKGINEGLNKIEGSFKRIGKLAAATIGVKFFVNLGKSAIDAASDLTEVQNIVDVTFTSMDKLGNIVEDDRYKIENFAKSAIENYGMSELAAKQTAGSFAAMGQAMGLTQDQATSMAVELTALTGDFSSFYNISQDYARVAMSAVYTGETETLKRYGIVLTEANLQEYAQSKGIEKSVKNMSAREKLILRYQYIQSVTNDIDGDFIRTQGTWANQTRVLGERWKQFLIVLGNGLTTVLLPLIKTLNALISVMTRWARAMGEVLAKLFGIKLQDISDAQGSMAGTGADAADAEQDLADATDAAAKAAKKALGPYDKLNVIQQDTSKSGAGSGDDLFGDLDFGDFIESQGAVSAAIDKLKLDINSFYELGQYVGGKITDILNSIPWDKAYEGARNFGTGLAEFLNGLISPELFSTVGRTVANALNTAIYAALSFGQTFDFTNLGLSIASGINSFFYNFDFASLAQTINVWVKGIFRLIVTTLTNVDWGAVFSGVKEFFSNLDPETLAILVGFVALKSVIKASILKNFTEGLSQGLGLVPLSKIFKNWGKAVGKSWKAINWENIIMSHQPLILIYKILGQMTSAWAAGAKLLFTGGNAAAAESALTFMSTGMKLIAGIPAVIAGAITAVASFVNMWKNGWGIIKTILEALGIALTAIGAIILGAPAAIAAIVAGVVFAVSQIVLLIKEHWDAICAVLGTIGTWIYDNVIIPVSTFFSYLGTNIANAFSSAWNFITIIWGAVSGWFNDNIITPVATIFEGVTTRISQLFEGCWILIKAVWIVVSTWFNDNIITPLSNAFNTLVTWITTIFSTAWNTIQSVWIVASAWFDTYVITPITTAFNILKTTLINIFSTAWAAIKKVFAPVGAFFNNVKNVILNIFGTVTNAVSSLFTKLWKGVYSGVVNTVNKIAGAFEKVVNGIISGINAFLNIFNKVVSTASKITGDSWGGVDLIPNVNIPRLAKGAVIPPNKEFMAVLGDQKQGTNIETPLSTMIEAFTAALDARGGSSNNQPIILQLPNGRAIAQLVWDEEEKRYKQTGSYRPKYS